MPTISLKFAIIYIFICTYIIKAVTVLLSGKLSIGHIFLIDLLYNRSYYLSRVSSAGVIFNSSLLIVSQQVIEANIQSSVCIFVKFIGRTVRMLNVSSA